MREKPFEMATSDIASGGEKIDRSVPCVVICPGYHGHGVARSLGRLGIPVYGVHGDPRSPTAKSRYWRESLVWDLSRASADESVDWFIQLARRIGSRPILISTDDHSCLFVEDNAEALQREYLFPRQPAGLSRSLSNKQELYRLCKENFILTPEVVVPRSRDDVVKFIKNATFPVMLKGIDTVALQKRVGLRMVIAKDADTLLKYYDEMETPDAPSLMLQEYIKGGAEDVWMFNGYFNIESNCLFGITGRKLRQYPAYTGMTSLGVCQTNETVFNLVKNLTKSIGYRGILDIGYKYNNQNGMYYLLDPNPRLGCSFRLFVDSNGMDVVRALYLDMTEQPVRVGNLKEGRKWVVEPFDIVSSYRYWRDGNLRLTYWLRSFRGVEEAQWFACDDMRPFWIVWKYSSARILRPIAKTTRRNEKTAASMKPLTKTADTVSDAPHQFEEAKKNVDTYFGAESSSWNEIYQKEDVYAVIHQDRRSIAFQYFQNLFLPRDARILDIGCGAGLSTIDIARCGYTVEAVDSVDAMIDLTRQNAVKYGVEKQIHAGVMDVSNLQFRDQTFDLVIALGVAPWLADLNRALNEISRVLALGGYGLLSMDNRWRLNHLLDPVDFPPFAGWKKRLRLFLEKVGLWKISSIPRPTRHTASEFIALLESAGLVTLRRRMIGFGPFTFLRIPLFPGASGIRLHRFLQNAADRGTLILRSTGSQYLVLVQKK